MDNFDAVLPPFLRELADSIEGDRLIPKQLKIIGEFYMTYKFQEQAIKVNDTSENPSNEFSKKELMRFITLGWYIYSVILKEKIT